LPELGLAAEVEAAALWLLAIDPHSKTSMAQKVAASLFVFASLVDLMTGSSKGRKDINATDLISAKLISAYM